MALVAACRGNVDSPDLSSRTFGRGRNHGVAAIAGRAGRRRHRLDDRRHHSTLWSCKLGSAGDDQWIAGLWLGGVLLWWLLSSGCRWTRLDLFRVGSGAVLVRLERRCWRCRGARPTDSLPPHCRRVRPLAVLAPHSVGLGYLTKQTAAICVLLYGGCCSVESLRRANARQRIAVGIGATGTCLAGICRRSVAGEPGSEVCCNSWPA